LNIAIAKIENKPTLISLLFTQYSQSQNNPQIEILKLACLFITHSEMYSTYEVIHFSLPIISR